MAKVTFNKITPIKKLDNKIITINDNEISVVQYLPTNEKGDLIERVLNGAIDDNGFYSPIRLEVLFHIEVIRSYTNISITDKMMEDPGKVYDALILNGVLDEVLDNIPGDEYESLFETVEVCAEQVSKYANSFAGMLHSTQNDFKITNESISKMMGTLNDPDAIGLVQDVLTKLG